MEPLSPVDVEQPIRRLLGRGHAIALLTALAILLSSLTLALMLPGRAIGVSLPLTLEPSSGPPGIQVTAIASEFGRCLSVDEDASTPVEDPIRIGLARDAVSTSGVVGFFWEDVQLATAPVVGDIATGSFAVPDTASLDSHRVQARCLGEPALRASATFTVTPPREPPVVVPNLIGMTVDEATVGLEDADLVLGNISGPGDRIREQTPDPGTKAERGAPVDVVLGAEPTLVAVPKLVDLSLDKARAALESRDLQLGAVSGMGDVVRSQSHASGVMVPVGTRVDITVGPVVPQQVTVPDLVGLDIDDVPGILVERGLVLGEVSGDGDVVRSQTPAPDTQVPSGSVVNVSVEAGTEPPPTVPVPDLVGGTVDEARVALTDTGLVLGNDADGDSTVEGQDPAAGTLVPVGSAVTVTLTEPAASIFRPTTWWAAAVLAVLLAAALLGPRGVRTRLDERWIRTHVRAVPATAAGPASVAAVPRGDSSPPTHVVRIEPHTDNGTHVLAEVDR